MSMKKLLSILFLLWSVAGFTQSEANNMVMVDTLIAVTNASNNGNGTGGTMWRCRAWIHRDTLSYPTIIFMPGAGQVQTGNVTTDTTAIHSYGPNFWQQQIGWNDTVVLGNGTHRPNVITVLQPAANTRQWYVLGLLQSLDAIYHPLHHVFYWMGFSEGSYIGTGNIVYSNNTANNPLSMSYLKAIVDLQGVNPDTTLSTFTYGYGTGFGTWASTYGGKFWGIEGTADTRNVWQLSQPANAGSAGSAYFTYTNYGGGGHGSTGSDGNLWNWVMDPRQTDWQNTGTITNTSLVAGSPSNTAGTYVKGENIYQWMLRAGDTTLVGGTTNPIVTAGSNQSIQLPANSATTTGTATGQGGHTISSTAWTQTSGTTATITAPTSLTTSFTGLTNTSTFLLTATDNTALTGSASITITVLAEVPPTVTPGGPYSATLPTSSKTIAVTASGNGGATISTYAWTKTSGPGSTTITGNTTASPTVSGLTAGTYVFHCVVTDSNGNTTGADVTVVVSSATDTHIITVAPGEYTSVGGGSDNLPICFSSNNGLVGIAGATSGIPKEITGTGTTFTSYNTTLHGGNAVDASGFGWVWGNNTDGELGNGTGGILGVINATKITTDSRGLPLVNITMMQGTYYQNGSDDIAGLYWVSHGALSDTLLYSGVGKYGTAADGSTGTTVYAVPTMVFGLPSGKRIKQMIGGIVGAYLLTDGTVWTWGANGNAAALGRAVSGSNYATPMQVSLPETITSIVGGGNAGILYLGTSGKLYGTSMYSGFMGNSSNPSYSTPTDLTTTIANHIFNGVSRTSITMMGCTALGFYLICNDGTLWFFGDNSMGGAGNGFQANLASPPGDSLPWFIDPSGLLYTPIYTPQQVGAKTNWTWVSSGVNFVFQVYCLDATNQLWSWGRNKGGVIPDGIIACAGDGGLTGQYFPNAQDRNLAYPVNPYTITTTYGQACLGCLTVPKQTGIDSPQCVICGTLQTPVARPTVSGTTLDGSTSSVGGGNTIIKYVWSQISGPNTAVIDAPGSPVAHLAGTTTGTYVLQLKVIDNYFDSTTSTVSVPIGTVIANKLSFPFRVIIKSN